LRTLMRESYFGEQLYNLCAFYHGDPSYKASLFYDVVVFVPVNVLLASLSPYCLIVYFFNLVMRTGDSFEWL
jgi:hypothetical protein